MTMQWEYPLDYLITIPIFIPLIVPYFIFMRHYVTRPIRTLIKYNTEFSEGLQEAAIIPDYEIPPREVGKVMESRNRMIRSLMNYQKDTAREKDTFKILNQSLISCLSGNLEEGIHLVLQHVCSSLDLESGWFLLYSGEEVLDLVVTYNLSHPFMTDDSTLICYEHCYCCTEQQEADKIHPMNIDVIQCDGLLKNDTAQYVLHVPLYINREDISTYGFMTFPVAEGYQISNSNRTLLEYCSNTLGLVLSQKELTGQLKMLNLTLETQVKERTSELQALYDLSQQIGYSLTFDDLARSILTHLQRIVPACIAATVLRIDGCSLLLVNHRAPIYPSEQNKMRERLVDSFSTVAEIEIDPTQFTLQLEEGEGYDASNPSVDDLESAFMVPLGSGGTTLGIVFIGSKEKYAFNEDQIRFFYTTANHFLTAIQQLRLRQSMEERRMENVVAEIPDGLLLLDSENRIRMANPMAQEYLQRLNANTSSKPGEILTALSNHSLEEILNSSKQSQHHEIAAGDSSTETIFEVVSKKMRIKDSPRTLLIIRDVSEMRLTQKGMRQRERLAAVGQLAAGIAHDFNNILQGIIGYSELLERSPEISEKSRNYIKNIVQQGQRAAYLINQILDFSRQSITKSQPFNLAPLIQETVKFFKRTIPENIDLSLEIEMDRAMIQADIVHVQQVLTNMVINARDAMPDGGTMKVRLCPFLLEKGDTPPITGMAHIRWVAFSVADTGCGIASEVLSRIFDPFFTTKEQGKGTGLGLSQAYGLVKQDNGFIHVDSNPGEGATFTVYLPELLNDDAKEPVLMTEMPLKGGGETILLVEDDTVVMDVNKSMLENLGYTVLTASNGREALEVCRSEHERVDLLLSDITMPEMDGIELLQTVKEQHPSLKVILMTGYPLAGENVKELKDMDVICLQKPVNLKQLASVIQHVFGEGRAAPKSD